MDVQNFIPSSLSAYSYCLASILFFSELETQLSNKINLVTT